jgi:hypothetical protein
MLWEAGTVWRTDVLSKVSVIHQLKCPSWEIQFLKFVVQMWNYWENFEKFFWSFRIIDGFIVSKVQKFTYYFQSVLCYNVSKSQCGNYPFYSKIQSDSRFLNNSCKHKQTQYKILSREWVTLDGDWIGHWIYWPLSNTWLMTILHRSLSHRD